MCESKSSYIIRTILYTGKETEKNEHYEQQGVSTSIVMKISENLLHQGYTFVMDNFYNSPKLFELLLAHKTDAYGTLRCNRKGLPKNFSKIKLKKDQAVCWMKEGLVAMKWHDKKDISLLSTCHDVSFQETTPKFGPKKMKPKIVIDYNRTMGGVDRADQQMTSYSIMRNQQKKFYKKIFRHLLDQCAFNAYVLYKKYGDKDIEHLAFLIKVIVQIMKVNAKNMTPTLKKKRPRIERNLFGDSTPARLTGRHFPKAIPSTDKKKAPTKRCIVCYSNKIDMNSTRKESRYYCKECDVALCVQPCFEIYHTQEDF